VAAEPGHRPFERAVAPLLVAFACKDFAGNLKIVAKRGGQIILETAGEMEDRPGRRLVLFLDARRVADPADFDAAEQISFRARHAVETRRLEGRALAEDLLVRMEAYPGAAPVVHVAQLFEFADRDAARKALAVKLATARYLDFEVVRQRVDNRH